MADQAAAIEIPLDEIQTSRPTTDTNLFIMLLVGLIGTVIISLGVIPLKDTKLNYVFAIINERGPVQFFELMMGFMVAALVVSKMRIVRDQLTVMAEAPIDPAVDFNNDSQVQDLRKRILTMPNFAWSLMLNRIERVLTLWLGTKDVTRVSEWASAQSERDSSSADASYTLARVLIWAIPIMGFIGTVMGLGSAVSSFSNFLGTGAGTVEQMQEAIGEVTLGLGVAFDTTLLALIMSVILMFPLSSIQRREDAFFAEMDNYLNDMLISNLPTPEQQPIIIENMEDSIEAAFRRYIPDPDRYQEVFSRSIREAAKAVAAEFSVMTKAYQSGLKETGTHIADNMSGIGKGMEHSMRKVIRELLIQEKAMLTNRKRISDQETHWFKKLVTGAYRGTQKSAVESRKAAETLQKAIVASSEKSLAAASVLAEKMDQVTKMGATIEDLLKIEKAVEKGIEGMSKSATFQNTLEAMQNHLEHTDVLCNRLSKPRVITLREHRV